MSFAHPDLQAIARIAMARYGFRSQFPSDVLEQVSAIKPELILKSRENEVKDLRELLWSSVDNIDSGDLDQLEYCQAVQNQEILVKVAIADVDFWVARKSKIDEHAAVNGTTVYAGIETFPMLPERLSEGITSLLPAQDRLAVVIEFVIKASGQIVPGDIYRALVCNKAKLVYEEIGSWLEGYNSIPEMVRGIPGLEAQLRLQDKAAQQVRKFRREEGALEFETSEAKLRIEQGVLREVAVLRDNPARQLIENFMIAANTTMAQFLEESGVPMIQRVVRVPKNWAGIVETARDYSETLPSQPDSKALSKFLLRRKEEDPEHFPDLSLTIIKLLGPGEYMMLEPGKALVGHFGLAVGEYTHATAPNRRYVDVIIQRLLKSVLEGEPCPYTPEELSEFSLRCTDRDKAAKKVERFMQKAAAASLLASRIGEVFAGIVTGASAKGNYVRIADPRVEGRVIRAGEGMRVGEKVSVRLISLDPYNGYIDFELAGNH